MSSIVPLTPVDYLVIGHLSRDLTPQGQRLGGTAAFSSLTARALGLQAGVVTCWGNELPLNGLEGVQMVVVPVDRSTTFENVSSEEGRVQYLHHVAPRLSFDLVPKIWQHTPIMHIGPIAREIDPFLGPGLSPVLLGLTPQGWLRTWDSNGRVLSCGWEESDRALKEAGATVLSIEDLDGDEEIIEAMALASRVLAVTEGVGGVRLYWNGDMRYFRAPVMKEKDATGAGDIFATAFFCRLHVTRDPWEAARFATQLASLSVTRCGLESIPTADEVQQCLVEVL